MTAGNMQAGNAEVCMLETSMLLSVRAKEIVLGLSWIAPGQPAT